MCGMCLSVSVCVCVHVSVCVCVCVSVCEYIYNIFLMHPFYIVVQAMKLPKESFFQHTNPLLDISIASITRIIDTNVGKLYEY